MKFAFLMALATVSAVTLRGEGEGDGKVTPGSNYVGRAKNLEEGLKVVAGQNTFEAKHEADHAAAMQKAFDESLNHKNSIRQAREDRVTSHDVTPYKTWGGGDKKE